MARKGSDIEVRGFLGGSRRLPLANLLGFPVGGFGDVLREIGHAGFSAAALSGLTFDYIFSLVVFHRSDIYDATPLFVEAGIFLIFGFASWNSNTEVTWLVVQVLADND